MLQEAQGYKLLWPLPAIPGCLAALTEGGKNYPIFGAKLVAKTTTMQFGIQNW